MSDASSGLLPTKPATVVRAACIVLGAPAPIRLDGSYFFKVFFVLPQ